MSRPRKARMVQDSDSSDSDHTTPSLTAPTKSSSRSRASLTGPSAPKVTFINSASASPAGINDDSLEKAQRRKRLSMGTPLHHIQSKEEGTSSQTALMHNTASKRRQSGRRLSAIVAGVNAEGAAVESHNGVISKPVESMEEMSLKFEEWMKMATDNKITVNNTWNFALIDYFADLTLLRNGPDDQSINFQKASSTLDGCVKIWTSRVDSAFTETGKLLSGLSETGAGEGEGGEDGEEGSEGEEGEDGIVRKKRKTHSKNSTLAPSFHSLSNKKLDLEFFVDPLFKKTSADFDEGGAAGLLMNHLGSAGGMRLIFDAGDVVLEEEGDVDLREEEEEEEESKRRLAKTTGSGKVDIQALRIKFPELSQHPSPIAPLQITSALSGFVFSSSSSNMLSFDIASLNAAVASASSAATAASGVSYDDIENPDEPGSNAQHDFFDFDDDHNGGGGGAGGDDFGGGQGDGYDEDGAVDEDGNPVGASGGSSGGGFGFEPFDPRRQPNEKDLVMAMVGGEGREDSAGQGEEMFDYFDRQLLARNWAGPEHWKTRRTVAFGKKDAVSENPSSTLVKTSRKPPPTIDFLSSEPLILASKLFELPSSKTSILLPASSSRRLASSSSKSEKKPSNAAAKKKAKDDKEREKEVKKYLLPDDLHFSSSQLLRLFTKKLFTLRMRRQGGHAYTGDNPPIFRGDGEVDEQFWAQAASNQADIRNDIYEDDGFGSQADPPPFATQFFNDDDYDGPVGFDNQDMLDADSDAEPGASSSMIPPEEQEETLWAGTQGLKRTRPDYVKFSKRAKRVDVKKLKDSIWKGLDIFAPPIEGEDEDEEIESTTRPTTAEDPTQPRVFSTVVSSLQSSYPSSKFSDISTSYCFICLLHLCNERGLQLEAARGDDGRNASNTSGSSFPRIVGEDDDEATDGEEDMNGAGAKASRDQFDETIVGQLGFLKIFKDQNAKGHA
ncbi:Chromosome condensation complex Condensin, subunit H [Phaffia rhodozyma]|uniref:Condensin complex subunit 2 n=1 Tax=Phaffia rhodozyma TaxID=264483 RepID=A0A0F7SK16_PHARH|nr:Chromosome condensation complex Condensin, subunit H [Phaffia rhodozyma]